MAIQTFEAGPKQIYQQKNFNSDLVSQAINISGKAIQQASQIKNDMNKVKLNNVLNEVNVKKSILLNEYKRLADPNDKQALDKFNTEYGRLVQDYEKKVPSSMLNQYKNQARQIEKQDKNQLEIWAFDKNIEQTQNSIQTKVLALQTQAQEYGEAGDFETAIINYANQSERLLENVETTLGEQARNQVASTLPSEYATYYINGLMQNNPSQAVVDLQKPEVKNMIGDLDTYNKLLNTAVNRQTKQDELQLQKDIAFLNTQEKDMFTKAKNQELDYISLNNFIEENSEKISKPTQEYLRKLGGFESTTVDKKIENNYQARGDIEENLIGIKINPEEITMDQVKNIQGRIFEYGNNGNLTSSQVNKYLEELNLYSSKIMEAKTVEDYTVNRFLPDRGGIEIKKWTNKLAKDMGYDKDDINNLEVAKMKSFVYSNYRENIDKIVNEEIIARGYTQEDFHNTDDFLSVISEGEKTDIFTRAVEETKTSYAKNIGIDTKEKTIDEIDTSIKIKENENKYRNAFNLIFPNEESDPLGYYNNYMAN